MVTLTLSSSGILSCTPIYTRVRLSNLLQFRCDSKGAMKSGASDPSQQSLGGVVLKTHQMSQGHTFGRCRLPRHQGEFVLM